MNNSTINLIYFSATGTTEKVIDSVIEDVDIKCVNRFLLTSSNTKQNFGEDEIAVFALPVYSGRIPVFAAETLNKYKGNNTPAIIIVVYGNRDFDDALVELRDIVKNNGFYVISAGAFIAQHAIFPEVGANRPDLNDLKLISTFGKMSLNNLKNKIAVQKSLDIVGNNNPYRAIKPIPLKPYVSNKCNNCGVCEKQCPVGAINIETSKKVNAERCISCARCINVCPQKARKFSGILYNVASFMFTRKYKEYKQPYIVSL